MGHAPYHDVSPSHASGGFTLVELMVVVAIIGVLSAVAVPNFKKYQAKSKTTEAKIQLAAAYTALQSFRSEYDTYQVCLKYMGYNPANEAAQRYYTVGFSTLSISDCADCYTIAEENGASMDTGNLGCDNGWGRSWFLAGKQLGSTALIGNFNITYIPVAIAEDTFVVGAMGVIDEDYAAQISASAFSINQAKKLINVRAGH